MTVYLSFGAKYQLTVNDMRNLKYRILTIPVGIITQLFKLPVTIKGTICVCPNELYEGFYLAKIKKIKKHTNTTAYTTKWNIL